MQRKTVKLEHPYCSNLNKEVTVKQNYVELPGEIVTKGKLACELAMECKDTTDCLHAYHEFGTDYLK